MVDIGKRQSLKIEDQGENGLLLEGGVLLPFDDLPETWNLGDTLDVFVYQTSDGVLTATPGEVFVEVGRCAKLKVVDVNKIGAFMDMGLPKDLLVPFKEQEGPMKLGRSYLVYVYLDNTGRITASGRLSRKVPAFNKGMFKEREAVKLTIVDRGEIGCKAVINSTHLGLIHHNEILGEVSTGITYDGWIQSIRDDDKINLTLIPKTAAVKAELGERILERLKAEGGSMTLTDKSDADEIRRVFGCSKGAFKKALGKLYKDRLVVISKDSVRLA